MENKPIHDLIWDDLGCARCRLRVGDYSKKCNGPPTGDAFYCNSKTWRCLRDKANYVIDSFKKDELCAKRTAQETTLGASAVGQIIPKAEF